MSSKLKSKLCYDRWSVSQSVLVSSAYLGHKIRFLLLSDSCGFVDVGRPLWRTDGSVAYNCSSPVGLMTMFYCLRFETPPTWKARSPYLYPPGTEWPGYTQRYWVPFSSPPTTRRAMVEVFEHTSTRRGECLVRWSSWYSLYTLGTDRIENTFSCS
jgi:hypothetical protein